MKPLSLAGLSLAVLVLGVAGLAAHQQATRGLLTSAEANGGNDFVTDVLWPPTGLTADPGGAAGTIDLNWTASVSPYVTGYDVYRSTTSGSYGAPVQSLPAGTTSWQDSGLTTGQDYFYVVRATYQNWQSDPSNEASAQAP